MNFFWKLFFSIMLITVTFFSLGGYVLIQSGFRASLEREVDIAYRDNDILYVSLNQSLDQYAGESYTNGYTTVMEKDLMLRSLGSLTVETSDGPIEYSIKDQAGEIILGSGPDTGSRLIEGLDESHRGYEISEKDGGYYIHCARPLDIQGAPHFIENYREITSLFESRSQQYRTFFYLMIALFLVSSIVILAASTWLVRPIRRLSRATKQVASGNYSRMLPVRGKDEIGQLTADFNSMTERLAESVDELKDAARRQEMFVNNFAHELKTPLTSMIGYADMLRSKRMDEEQSIFCADQIVREGKRLSAMSMKLMELILLKKQTFPMRSVTTRWFFEDVCKTVVPVMEKSGIEFQAEAQDARLLIEPDLMKTVCINLLDNARKAVEEGGKIMLSGSRIAGGYEITVSDNGCGIPQEELSKLTEAFYMVDKARARESGGAGLGLAICAEILRLHNGSISFFSEPEKGTLVAVRLKEGNEHVTD